MQIPAGFILAKVPPAFFLSGAVFCWGIISMCCRSFLLLFLAFSLADPGCGVKRWLYQDQGTDDRITFLGEFLLVRKLSSCFALAYMVSLLLIQVGVAEAVCRNRTLSHCLPTTNIDFVPTFSALLPWCALNLVEFLYPEGNRRPNRHYVLGQQFVKLFWWIDCCWCHFGYGGQGWFAGMGMALYVAARAWFQLNHHR